jgi:glycosyltransferase involved in cell wall biosynthesis
MRVLLLSDWMTEPGGSEAYMTTLRDALRAAGDEVLLLGCGAGEAGAGRVDRRAWGTDRVIPQAVAQVVNPLAARAVRAVRRDFRPDVVLVGNFAYHLSPAVFGALEGVPVVLAVMDYKLVCPLGTKLLPDGSICRSPAGAVCRRTGCLGPAHWTRDQVRYAAIRRGLRRVSTVLSPSRAVQDELAASGIGSRRIPLPIAAATVVPRHRAPVPLFLYCGRLSREKGVDILLRAFAAVRARVPDATLRILGDGPARADLERLCRELLPASEVVFLGRQPFTRVEQELAGAWALVAPSRWAEPFGLVAPEAIVRQVPVIASRTGGFAESIADGVTGLLVDNGNIRALSDAMAAVAEGRALPHPPPPDIVSTVALRHDAGRYTEQLRTLFRELIAGVRREPGAPA